MIFSFIVYMYNMCIFVSFIAIKKMSIFGAFEIYAMSALESFRTFILLAVVKVRMYHMYV